VARLQRGGSHDWRSTIENRREDLLFGPPSTRDSTLYEESNGDVFILYGLLEKTENKSNGGGGWGLVCFGWGVLGGWGGTRDVKEKETSAFLGPAWESKEQGGFGGGMKCRRLLKEDFPAISTGGIKNEERQRDPCLEELDCERNEPELSRFLP